MARLSLLGRDIRERVEKSITTYENSRLREIIEATSVPPMVIKFVDSSLARKYGTANPLKISSTPALTWGTGTYVTPLAFPLSPALYGRVGLVTPFEPTDWRVFDATEPASRQAYLGWVQAQADYDDLVYTVHSTDANHQMRNRFRRSFKIDCVLFHPDQEAEQHTNASRDVWMLVTDWTPGGQIASGFSARLKAARFVVLLDEQFRIDDSPVFRRGALCGRSNRSPYASSNRRLWPYPALAVTRRR